VATARYTIDLHAHSTRSDGVLAPGDLVRRAAARGVRRLALTDHDTLAGLDEAHEAGADYGVGVVDGIEVSAWHSQEVHILGYFVRRDDGRLSEVVERQRRNRLARVQTIADRLARLGMDIDVDAVLASAHGNVGRPHIARALVDAGHVPSFDAAFDRLLGKGAAAYVPASRLTASHAVRVIHEAGGAAVLAHPGVEKIDPELPALVEAGLDGLEVDHPAHDEGTAAKYVAMARRLGLVTTGGSDFHRPGARADLGDHGISESSFDALQARSEAR
jgi:hypothetical protein